MKPRLLAAAFAALALMLSQGARADGTSAPANPAVAAPCAHPAASLLPEVVDEHGHLRENYMVPLEFILDPAGLPPAVASHPSALEVHMLDPEAYRHSFPVHIREIGTGPSTQYVVDIHQSSMPPIQLRGTEVLSGTYRGSARFGQYVSMHALLDTGGGILVSHDTDFRVIAVNVNSQVRIVGLVRQSIRAGESPHAGGFAYGAGGAAGLTVTTSDGRPVSLLLSAVPAVGSTATGKVSVAPILGAGLSFDY